MAFAEFSVGLVMFLFASAQLFTRNRSSIHYYMALVCYCGAYFYFYLWSALNGIVLPAALWSSDISAMFLIAPTFYLASSAILREKGASLRRAISLIAGPTLFAVGFGAYNSIVRTPEAGIPGDSPGHFSSPLLNALTTAGILAFAIAILLCLVAAYRIHASGKVGHRSLFLTQVLFLLIYLACVLLALYACVGRDRGSLEIASLAYGMAAVGFTLTASTIRYLPDNRLGRSRDNAHSRAWDLESISLAQRLGQLMEKAASYRDADLTLEGLARMLRVEPKRLTYHFRTSLSTNFRGYINGLRLKAVCRDLVEKPDEAILTIAFENGFNSKSSFNTLFFQAYGMTPREFRSRPGEAVPQGRSGESGTDRRDESDVLVGDRAKLRERGD